MAHPRVLAEYTDALGRVQHSSPEAVAHADEVLRAAASSPGELVDVVRCAARGPTPASLVGRVLHLEGGGDLVLPDVVPDDVPHGYHRADGDRGLLLVLHAPARCPQPAGPGWFVAAQLYAARSADSWGIGDLRDARRIRAWVDGHGPGGHVMLNPLHAPIPGPHPQPSPYFSSSRIFRNPLYLCVEEVPGAAGHRVVAEQRERAVVAGAERLIDHSSVWDAKRTSLLALWADGPDARSQDRIDTLLADPGGRRYAEECARLEEPDDPRFHAWLQVLLEDQLLAVGPGLIHDVAVGVDRAGVDARLWPDLFVLDGTKVGAPADEFNTQGQDWGLPPLHPVALRAAGYEPFVRAVRSVVTGAAGIRLDHVMGLERLYWIRPGASPVDGVYVTYDLDELLDVVAIEAGRAGAFVIGEDLGTVPDAIKAASEDRGLLGYRVMSLDADPPSTFPERAAAALTTHDLPTIVGLVSGSDLAEQERLGLEPNRAGVEEAVARLLAWTGLTADDDPAELVVRLHELLAASPAMLVAATLDDLALVAERPNMPGTIDEWPNWRIALPVALEDLLASDVAGRVAAALSVRGSTHAP
ncbi:MAG: 4-alpha-glucanotransferase [Acidimicrobiales bacterium]|nr:4-alpha-glucanotransferase [Acidimicrobiales bacterium]